MRSCVFYYITIQKIPSVRNIFSEASLSASPASSRGTIQHMPQPAEISPGTGISLPGMLFSRQYLSKAMASVVVRKVMILLKVFSLAIDQYSSAISLTAFMAVSISSSVLKYEKLNLTAPCSEVPRASCMSGAQ